MRDWVIENIPSSTNPFVLDLGSGNGNVLFELFDAGYDPRRLCGIDYSADAVQLARNISTSHQASEITFSTLDFLKDDPEKLSGMDTPEWDLILDKGTLDAIALAPRIDGQPSPADKYPERVGAVLKQGGYLLITCMLR